jgi:N-acyl-D-aspartate/D-glutamate deacylase
MSEFDLVIRGGTLIDGTGAERQSADVAVKDGIIAEVGKVSGHGHREVEADGRLVQPGFVDIHTHYDGQATWDSQLAPSSWHGVTTVVMGNCGVGFAPVRPSDHERLVQLMEGVEDIPGTALHEGLPWAWESFEEYLDYLDGRSFDIDVGAQLPHAAVRVNVMGERGANREPANAEDIAHMAEITRRAVEAGAIGFTTSRTLNHRSSLGEPTPTLKAEMDEMIGIARALGQAGKGVIQLVSDFLDFEDEFALARAMGETSGRPVSISVAQAKAKPDTWWKLLDAMEQATREGVVMRAQVGSRPVGVILSMKGTVSPFMHCDTYKTLKKLPFAQRLAEMRKPETRAKIISEATGGGGDHVLASRMVDRFHVMFRLGNPPVYEPNPEDNIANRAAQQGVTPQELAYDVLMENDGLGLLYIPILNFADGNLDNVRKQLLHPVSVPGLSDGGAHVGTICDVSFPTTLMQWWGRDRPHDRIPLETLVMKQARATAEAVGFMDRGVIAPGYKADINVIDFDRLTLHAPDIAGDLPAGGNRFLQKVTGIDHTFVSGVEVASNSESTGEIPGGLVRGAQASPR